jgi:hypothetical protein
VRALALVLLCACTGPAAAPASLPWVRIDRTLSGPVCSREAAEVIAARREIERGQAAVKLIGCEAKNARTERERDAAGKEASSGRWWRTYGIPVIIGAAAISAAVGGAVGYELGRKR